MSVSPATWLAMVLILAFASATPAAQAAPASVAASAPAPSRAAQIDFAAMAVDSGGAAAAPGGGGSGVPPDVAAADLKDLAAHIAWQRQFAKDSWSWHLFSTKMLMFVVLSIVAFGLLITYIQFTRDGRSARRGKAASPLPAPVASTLKLSAAGVEITSQVIGLLVLGFSLAFFYLYVKVVYPIQEVELQREAKSAAAAPLTAPAPK